MIKKHQEKTRFLLGLCCIVMSCVLLNQVYEPEKDRHAVYLLANENIGDTEEPISLYSKNALLIRLSDHQVLWESGSKEMIYPASMTKMMTAILAIEAVDDLNTQVTLPSDIFAPLRQANASMAGFLPGETATVKDLLYGTLLPSGAEAAQTLALYVSGSEEAFVELMNEKARRLGMKHTHFVNVTGLHDDRHVTTLEDMALLMDYALDQDMFKKILTSKTYTTAPTGFHDEGLTFESTIFSRQEASQSEWGILEGGKTGYTQEAGLCLASLAKIRDQEYILLTAGACGDPTTKPYHILDAVTVYSHIQ